MQDWKRFLTKTLLTMSRHGRIPLLTQSVKIGIKWDKWAFR